MKPILFSTPMVEAILNTKPDVWPPEPLDGSQPFKWQTRRLVKPQPPENVDRLIIDGGYIRDIWRGPYRVENGELWKQKTLGKVPWKVGEHLWVREKWRCIHTGGMRADEYATIEYAAGGTRLVDLPKEKAAAMYNKTQWRPSIFMPGEAARLFLEVKGVRVERLQDISEEDAAAEGPQRLGYAPKTALYICLPDFRGTWNRIYAPRGYPWDSNPWVWVVEFMRKEAGE